MFSIRLVRYYPTDASIYTLFKLTLLPPVFAKHKITSLQIFAWTDVVRLNHWKRRDGMFAWKNAGESSCIVM